MTSLPIHVPDLGDSKGAEVIEILAAVGSDVDADAPLIQLESDKAVMEISSPRRGRVTELRVVVGDRVFSGQCVASIADAEATAALAPPVEAGDAPRDDAQFPVEQAAIDKALQTPVPDPVSVERQAPLVPAAAPSRRIYAGPAVRRLAREVGVSLEGVPGSGPRGRVLRNDVLTYVRSHSVRSLEAPAKDIAAFEADVERLGPVDYEPMSRIQKVSARRLAASWSEIPHVTQHNEADITVLEDVRQSLRASAKDRGIRLTLVSFLLRAVVIGLREMPRLNASVHPGGDRVVLKRYYNLGFAADTPNGLIVPVIREVDRKDVFEIARELADLSEIARAGKLSPVQVQGSTFTVSSLGGLGGTHFTPIVNAPEVAILGAGRANTVPRYVERRVKPRLILPLSLSYDHRVIDGAAGVRFTERICELLSDPVQLLTAVP